MQAWVAFLTAHARMVPQVSEALEAACGIPLTWFDVLHQLRRSPGGRRRMHELAAAVLLSKSGLTRLVDRIEEAGLVTRAAVPGDRRSLHVELTPAGRRLALEARGVVRRLVEERFAAHLTDDELATLRDALGRVAHARSRGAEPPAAPRASAEPPQRRRALRPRLAPAVPRAGNQSGPPSPAADEAIPPAPSAPAAPTLSPP